jgi:two-component system sensor histidine kinase PilS (NtrC family)
MQIVTEEADRLDAIIREFLLFARPPARATVACDLPSLIDDTIVLFRRDLGVAGGIDVVARHAPDLPLALIDAHQIRQVLWNLLKNAGEAMSEPGRIDVETSLSPAGDAVVVSVTDDGPGVENMDVLFQPFYTTRAQGTGLGLAVVARVVRDHGGSVSVHNVPGRGACFSIALPLSVDGAKATA